MQANRLVLGARLLSRGELRYTPVGLPAIDLVLFHESQQAEAGRSRKVDCELAAVAFGATAESLARVAVGSVLRCDGFLARRYRTGTSLALHVDTFELNTSDTEGN